MHLKKNNWTVGRECGTEYPKKKDGKVNAVG